MARYLIKYQKGKGVKFISHLDLMRAFQRAIRRAKLPISYSKGFNPHAEFSLASPLPVGTWSIGEYMDIKLDEAQDPDFIMNSMNSSLPPDIRVIKVRKVGDKFPSLMSIVSGASYEMTLAVGIGKDIKIIDLEKFMERQHIEVVKTGKNGSRIVDIKPMIHELKLKCMCGDTAVFSFTVDAGSRSNLGPELMAEAMTSYIDALKGAEIRDIKKIETFVSKGGKLCSPMELSESDYA